MYFSDIEAFGSASVYNMWCDVMWFDVTYIWNFVTPMHRNSGTVEARNFKYDMQITYGPSSPLTICCLPGTVYVLDTRAVFYLTTRVVVGSSCCFLHAYHPQRNQYATSVDWNACRRPPPHFPIFPPTPSPPTLNRSSVVYSNLSVLIWMIEMSRNHIACHMFYRIKTQDICNR